MIDTDIVFILTEWEEFKILTIRKFYKEMKEANIYDGRNCFSLKEIQKNNIKYYSIGRRAVDKKKSCLISLIFKVNRSKQ